MTMIFSAAIALISSRTSCFWFGSRPSVGSSRISTGGSCRIAWARPTRRRKPLDSVSIGCLQHRAKLQPRADLVDAALECGATEAADPADELQELAGRHFAVGGRTFRQIAEPALGFERLLVDAEAADFRIARLARHEAGQHAHGGGLAGTVGPEEAQHFARAHAERDVIDGPERPVVLVETFCPDHRSDPDRFTAGIISTLMTAMIATTVTTENDWK